jgi:hypothetical protein
MFSGGALEQEVAIPQALAEIGVVTQRRQRAVDVELGVAPGVAPVAHGHLDEGLALGVNGLAHGLQQRAAAGEAQRAQGRPPVLRANCKRRAEVEPGRAARREPASVVGSKRVAARPSPRCQRPDK